MSGATVSINKKWADGTLIQIGGVGFADFTVNLAGFVGDDEANRIVESIASSFRGGSTPAPAPQQQQQQQQQQSAPANSQAPTCAHGARVWKAGTSKAGKAYKMWACPSEDRASQCEPSWVR